MIKNNLLPNATDSEFVNLYEPNTTKLTAKISTLNLTEIPLQYSVGYIKSDNVPFYHKLSRVTKTGNHYKIESITKKQTNFNVLQIATINDEASYTIATVKNDKLTNVKFDNYTPSTLSDIRFVNSVNISNTANNNVNIYLVFYAIGTIDGYTNTAFYGRLDGFKNIDDFINGRRNITNLTIAQQLSTGRFACHIPDVNIEDFNSGSHVYEFSENGYTQRIRVWIAGINYVNGFKADTWDGRNWTTTNRDKICLKNAYVVETNTDKKYLSGTRPTNFPEYSSMYYDNTLPNGYDLEHITNYIENNCIFADIDCEFDDIVYSGVNYPHGDNWIALTDNKCYIYYCCNADEIKRQIAQTCRALINADFVYENNPLSYGVNNNFIYPEIKNDNEFTGNYIIPSSESDILSWQNSDNIADNNIYDYNYIPPYRPNDDSDFGDLISNIGINTQTVSSGKIYKINTSDANTVLNFIGGTYSTDLILSPSDGLISFQYFPFEIPSYISAVPKIGAYNENGEIHGFTMPSLSNNYHFVNKTAFLIDLGKTRINSMYNDFRDFPPYTTYSAFIPFVNTSYNIDFAIFKNHEIAFKLIVDVITGSGIVCIMRDGLLYDTVNGSVSTTINITSADMAQYNASIKATENAMQSNELNAKLAMVNMVTGLTSSIATASTGNMSGITGAVSSVTGGLSAVANASLQRDMLEYQLSTTQVHHSTIQSASANCGNQLERNVHIIIAHAKMLPEYNAEIYADTVGYACCINDKLSNCSHYTQVANIDLSGILCTDAEKILIKTALTNGVVIK